MTGEKAGSLVQPAAAYEVSQEVAIVSNTPRFGFLLEYVDDVNGAKAFYTDVLGLKIDRESPVFIQFTDDAGVKFAIASDDSLSGTRAPEVYWVVEDAAAALDELPSSAVITHALHEEPFGKVRGIKDPAVQTQFSVARDRPNKAVE